jgi:hypothetical protein
MIETLVWIIGYFMSSLFFNLLILDWIYESKYKDQFNFDKQFKWITLIIGVILIAWTYIVPIFLIGMFCYWIIDLLLTCLGCIVILIIKIFKK